MSNMSIKIKNKLTNFFVPFHLLVTNESIKHNFSKNTETHFKIVLVTEKFIQQKLLQRHRTVYLLLAEELSNGVHSLNLYTYTPVEWKEYQHVIFFSPCCFKKKVN
ncbi:MAG: BolA/IbaG family iron-sulfur metabolism protein [Arsenophonus sp.]|nr:MAG: BolA/IbaG family iron-sulfur metabolism protein [Arsenophonus sp.]